MVNFVPLTSEIRSGVWSIPANFTGFVSWLCYCSNIAHRRPTKLAGPLAVSWFGTLYIHFWGLLPPNRIVPSAKFTLRPSHAFSYTDSVTAWHSSSGHQQNFMAWHKEWNYRTFALGGHHVGHWPTF